MYSCETNTRISFRTSPSLHKFPCAHLQSLAIPIPATTNLLSLYIPFHKWNLAICNLFYLASFHKHVFEIHPCCSCIGSLFLFTVFSFLHGYTVSLSIHQLMITRWSTPKSDWLYSLQPKMEKLYTVNKNKTRSWLWLRSWTPCYQIQTETEESRENH